MILLAARRRQGGAGGGAFIRAEQKLVENRGGSHDGDDVTGTAARAAFCFFFFDDRFSFCAALKGGQSTDELKLDPNVTFTVHIHQRLAEDAHRPPEMGLFAVTEPHFHLLSSLLASTFSSFPTYFSFCCPTSHIFFYFGTAETSGLTHSAPELTSFSP